VHQCIIDNRPIDEFLTVDDERWDKIAKLANKVVFFVDCVRHPNIQLDAANTHDLSVNKSSAIAEMAAQFCTSQN